MLCRKWWWTNWSRELSSPFYKDMTNPSLKYMVKDLFSHFLIAISSSFLEVATWDQINDHLSTSPLGFMLLSGDLPKQMILLPLPLSPTSPIMAFTLIYCTLGNYFPGLSYNFVILCGSILIELRLAYKVTMVIYLLHNKSGQTSEYRMSHLWSYTIQMRYPN